MTVGEFSDILLTLDRHDPIYVMLDSCVWTIDKVTAFKDTVGNLSQVLIRVNYDNPG